MSRLHRQFIDCIRGLNLQADNAGNCTGLSMLPLRALFRGPLHFKLYCARMHYLQTYHLERIWPLEQQKMLLFSRSSVSQYETDAGLPRQMTVAGYYMRWASDMRAYEASLSEWATEGTTHLRAKYALNLLELSATVGLVSAVQQACNLITGPSKHSYKEHYIKLFTLAADRPEEEIRHLWRGSIVRPGTQSGWDALFTRLEGIVLTSAAESTVGALVCYRSHLSFVGYTQGRWFVMNPNEMSLLFLPDDMTLGEKSKRLYDSFYLHDYKEETPIHVTIFSDSDSMHFQLNALEIAHAIQMLEEEQTDLYNAQLDRVFDLASSDLEFYLNYLSHHTKNSRACQDFIRRLFVFLELAYTESRSALYEMPSDAVALRAPQEVFLEELRDKIALVIPKMRPECLIDEDGSHLLHFIASSGSAESLETFLYHFAHDVDINVRDALGRTPLFVAASVFQCRQLSILLSYGANPHITTTTDDGVPQLPVQRFMVAGGVAPDIVDIVCRTLRNCFSVYQPFFEAVEGSVPLETAAELSETHVKTLLQLGASTRQTNSLNETPAYAAARRLSLETLYLLSGVDMVVHRNVHGEGLLHVIFDNTLSAAEGEEARMLPIASYLLRLGFCPQVKDVRGRTPLKLAEQAGFEVLASLFRSYLPQLRTRRTPRLF